MPTTTISTVQNRYRVTIPKAVREALALDDRDAPVVTVRPRWSDSGLALALTLGEDTDTDATKTLQLTDYQARVELPRPIGVGWGLGGATARWPDPAALDAGATEFLVGVDDWAPRVDVAAPDERDRATLGVVDATGRVEGTLPSAVAQSAGLDAGTVGWTMTVVDGQPAVVLRRDAPEGWPTLELRRGGAEDASVVFGGGKVATALGVRAGLGSVGVGWATCDGGVVGVVED